MEPHHPDLKTIFCEALERPAGPERRAYLEGACRNDPVLRAQVEELLGAHVRAGDFLDSSPGAATSAPGGEPEEDAIAATGSTAAAGPPRPAEPEADATSEATDPPDPPPSTTARPIAEGPGSRIGPYKLLQEIGQGGMGAVFMAEQDQPVRRRVALKIIKAGMDSRQVVARFEAERQALALMDHPNIARVLDAGTTDSRPPVLRHGAGQGHADHPVLRRGPAGARRSGSSCSSRSAGRSSTRTRRGSSTATSSPPTSWSPSSTASRCPR